MYSTTWDVAIMWWHNHHVLNIHIFCTWCLLTMCVCDGEENSYPVYRCFSHHKDGCLIRKPTIEIYCIYKHLIIPKNQYVIWLMKQRRYNHLTFSDLQYISIRQYIDTVIEYRIMILCSMSIEISKWLYSTEWCMSYATFLCVKVCIFINIWLLWVGIDLLGDWSINHFFFRMIIN